MTRILCLWLPNWAIQRVVAARGETPEGPLRGRVAKPQAVVLAAEGSRGGVVVACCEKSIDEGIRPQTPVAEAKSLVPDLAIVKHDPAADRQALAELAAACEEFSPCVAIEEGDAPESLLLGISNLEHLWGSEAKLASRVEAFFVERGWRVRLAVAGTVGVAWGVAHANDEIRMTNDEEQTADHSSFVIRHSGISPRLPFSLSPPLSSSLPVEALRIADDTAALLRELGIETVGQLLALPREELASRFGEHLLLRLDQWTGTVAEVLVPHRPPAALEAGWSLEQPTGDRGMLAQVFEQLVACLAAQLAARDQGAVVLLCHLGCVAGQSVPLRIGLFAPSACPRQLMELVGLHLETVVLPDEVARVEICAAATGRLGERQGELFADRWASDPHQLALLVNRLASRLGGEQVLRAELRESALPERAVRWVAVTERRGGEKRKKRRVHSPPLPLSPSSPLSAPRPLLLYPQPRSIEVTSVAPDGPPQMLWLDGRRERVVRHWGPERIETLWWRGRSVRRDYYRVATEGGKLLWIFRRIVEGGWFFHGVFT